MAILSFTGLTSKKNLQKISMLNSTSKVILSKAAWLRNEILNGLANCEVKNTKAQKVFTPFVYKVKMTLAGVGAAINSRAEAHFSR